MHVLSTPIEYLKGVGPVRSELLKKELRIFTYEDLLMHFPFRYVDKSNIYKISEINDSLTQIQFKGKIVKIEEKGMVSYLLMISSRITISFHTVI